MADELLAHTDAILEANKQDVEAAKGKISDVMIDRLMLDAGRIEGMAKGIRELICLEDPAGKVIRTVERPNGIIIEKTAVPMGVIAIIYESRPNVVTRQHFVSRVVMFVFFEVEKKHGRVQMQ